MKKGEYDKAEEILKKAIEINPEYEEAYSQLGWCYRKKGEYDKTEEILKKAI
ncbi:tetratricopeptide repeat protein [Elusimicrobiota bacterium]